MAAVAAVTLAAKLAADSISSIETRVYTDKCAVHLQTYTECTPTIVLYTRLCHFRDQSAAKCAVVLVEGGGMNDLWRVQ